MSDLARSYGLLFRWHLLRQRQLLVLLIGIQIALGIGVIYGLAFLVPHISPSVALYLSTGAPALTMILLGFSVVPQELAQARVSGRYVYVSALPVPRLAPMLAEVTFWMVVQVPGAIVTLLLAMLRFHVHLHVSVLIVPVAVLVTLTTATVGYALAVSAPPTVTTQLTQFFSIVLLLFSPINFPLSRLPVWLQDVHRMLPVTYMADLVRGSLTGVYDSGRTLAFAVVAAWCVAGLVLSSRAAARRG